jgi:hypothetical protein
MLDTTKDAKKQHFAKIYLEKTPVPYKIHILDALDYISDDYNRRMFDRLILPWVLAQRKSIQYVDLCGCFGNTTLATVFGMTYDQICENWKDETACMKIEGKRRFPCTTTAIDISENATAYGEKVGIYDTTLVCDLNELDDSLPEKQAVLGIMKTADVMIATAALVYLDIEGIDSLVGSFASKATEGYMLVNFLNPFALEKADATKRVLLKHLEFVGSNATRHRKMSQLEQDNYPGEEWALLELWVLKRRGKQTHVERNR